MSSRIPSSSIASFTNTIVSDQQQALRQSNQSVYCQISELELLYFLNESARTGNIEGRESLYGLLHARWDRAGLGYQGTTILMTAASHAYYFVVKKLIDSGVNPNSKNKIQASVLWFAVQPKKPLDFEVNATIRFLLLNGAQLNGPRLTKKASAILENVKSEINYDKDEFFKTIDEGNGRKLPFPICQLIGTYILSEYQKEKIDTLIRTHLKD